MCSLPEHTARSAREHEAQTQEPIYAALAAERGIDYEPPASEPAVELIRQRPPHPVYIPEHMRGTVTSND